MTDLTTLLEVGGPVAALGGGAAYTRAKHPGVYWSAVGLPISTARLLSSYGSVMEACGLSVTPSRLRVLAVKATTRGEIRPVPPRRGIIRPTTTGLRLRLRLAPGQEPADVAASAERLRHAWGVHAVYVTTVKPGVVDLRLVGYDVLREVRMPRKAVGGFLKVPVALREDATPFVRDYRVVPHGLSLGATLSGKSMYLRHLVAGLAPQPVALVGIDCKRGVELAPFASRLSALATDPEQAAELLPVLIKEMEDRYDLIKARQRIAPGTPNEEITSDIWGLPEQERPVPVVLFVDEVAELFLVATKKEEERRDEMVTQLIRLAQLDRAAGIYLEVCGQRFGAELGKGATMLRAQLTGRVCHRVNDEASAKMALGDVAPEAVSAACAIPAERPGLAVAGDTSGGWSRIRTPYLSLSDAAETCRASAHLVSDLPALKPFRPSVPAQPVESAAAPVVQPRPITGLAALSCTPVGVTVSRQVPAPAMPESGRSRTMRAQLARIDAVLVQAVIAAALSFAHLHDVASAAGQDGWKAWAYPISVDLLLVAAWRRLRTGEAKAAGWCWFVIALAASLGANVATAGLLDMNHVPAWLRILVAGWPAVAFLGGTLLAHSTPTPPDEVREQAPDGIDDQEDAPDPVPELSSSPAPATESAPTSTPPLTVALPAALVDHARKVATEHHARTGTAIDTTTLRARLGVPMPMADAIAAQL